MILIQLAKAAPAPFSEKWISAPEMTCRFPCTTALRSAEVTRAVRAPSSARGSARSAPVRNLPAGALELARWQQVQAPDSSRRALSRHALARAARSRDAVARAVYVQSSQSTVGKNKLIMPVKFSRQASMDLELAPKADGGDNPLAEVANAGQGAAEGAS